MRLAHIASFLIDFFSRPNKRSVTNSIYDFKVKSLEGKGPDTPRAIIPLQAAVRSLDVWRGGLTLMVRPHPTASQTEVMDEVMASMRARRGLKPGARATFYLVEQDRIVVLRVLHTARDPRVWPRAHRP